MAPNMTRRSSELATPPIDYAMTGVERQDRAALAPGKMLIILNGNAGAVDRMGHAAARLEIIQAFTAHGIAAEIVSVRAKTIARIVGKRVGSRDAPATAPQTIVAAGGDGTVNAVVQALAGTA